MFMNESVILKLLQVIEAPAIFTTEEKEVIRQGFDARVWIEVTKTDKKNNLSSPATGDMAHPVLWMAMMFLTVLAIAGVWSRRKKDCR